jgi:hypothetical protein
MSGLRSHQRFAPLAPRRAFLPGSYLRLALAGLGVAAGCLALSWALGVGPASTDTVDSPPLGSRVSIGSTLPMPASVTAPQPATDIAHAAVSAADLSAATSPLAVFRATTSMTSAQRDACPAVSIDSWRAPVEDSGQLTSTNGMGMSSESNRLINGPVLSSDALPDGQVMHRAFALGDRACSDDLPTSPTYELASTPG